MHTLCPAGVYVLTLIYISNGNLQCESLSNTLSAAVLSSSFPPTSLFWSVPFLFCMAC